MVMQGGSQASLRTSRGHGEESLLGSATPDPLLPGIIELNNHLSFFRYIKFTPS